MARRRRNPPGRALESLIDANSLYIVLDEIALVCEEKARHIYENWDDRVLAASWLRAGRKITTLAKSIQKQRL